MFIVASSDLHRNVPVKGLNQVHVLSSSSNVQGRIADFRLIGRREFHRSEGIEGHILSGHPPGNPVLQGRKRVDELLKEVRKFPMTVTKALTKNFGA